MNTPKPAAQIGGTHYSDLSIEPIQFTEANGLGFHEGNVIKYISRWRNKNGLEDIRKALWYCERLLEVETARVEQEMRQERVETIEMIFGCQTCEDCESPCMVPQNASNDLEDAEDCKAFIVDLEFFGWNTMSEDRRDEVRAEAARHGRDIVEQLRVESQDATDSLKWHVD